MLTNLITLYVFYHQNQPPQSHTCSHWHGSTPRLMDVTGLCCSMCVFSDTHTHTHKHTPVPLCWLMATPSAVMLTHSRGDSHRTSSTLTDTFLLRRAISKPTWSRFQRPFWHPRTAAAQPVERRFKYRIVYIGFICGCFCAHPTGVSQLMSCACIFVGTRPFALEMRRRRKIQVSFCFLLNSCTPTCAQYWPKVSFMAGGAHYMDNVRCNSRRLAHVAPWSAVEPNGTLLKD